MVLIDALIDSLGDLDDPARGMSPYEPSSAEYLSPSLVSSKSCVRSPSLVSSKSCVRKRESVERRVCIPRPRRQCALKVKDARRDLRFRPWKIQVAILNFARLGVVAELRNRDKIACGFMGDEG